MTWTTLAFIALAWFAAAAVLLAVAFRSEIVRAWREPVLGEPVLIFESDDWGYGPLEQAQRLGEISALLARHRDATGHPAVMTLGVVLAGPDGARIGAGSCTRYHRLTLADARYDRLREAMREGERSGVFALQLHGMEHYWPPVLMRAAASHAGVREWITSQGPPRTEDLPAPLQSRWIDAASLPSHPLPEGDVEQGVEEEVAAFRAVFGRTPEVAVPPTFVWSPEVERAWARAGLTCLVSPGRRYHGRDAGGRPVSDGVPIANGQRAEDMVCVVRDDYFEPALGHRAERALAQLEAKTRLGRPCLLETHRMNFLGDPALAARSLAELDRVLAAARARWPGLRFLPTAELAGHLAGRTWPVDTRLAPRLNCLVARLAAIARLRKLAWASGLAVPAGLLWLATRAAHAAPRAK
ncbi:MAG: hypothetical protein OHK0026_04650 [Rhodocyclaceae bacterium]